MLPLPCVALSLSGHDARLKPPFDELGAAH
jgi:hypothetical protein